MSSGALVAIFCFLLIAYIVLMFTVVKISYKTGTAKVFAVVGGILLYSLIIMSAHGFFSN